MRRFLATGIVLVSGVAAGAGPAGARVINGTEGNDRLAGTRLADVIRGLGGNDVIDAFEGADVIVAGAGADRVTGGRGDDRIAVHADRSRDTVTCGAGADLVNAELADVVAPDCEVVSRQLSRDPYENFDSQHETQVEPDSFSFGKTIVATFQSGRFEAGGASNIGYSTSKDGGVTWRSGFLPALTLFSTPAGTHEVVSDPVVTYDARHATWLIATFGRSPDSFELRISRSRDGLVWSAPVVAFHDSAGAIDKEWVACDNGARSPFRGRCYMSYLADNPGNIVTQSSTDGGQTWTGPVAAPGAPETGIVNGAQPVVQPGGALVVVYASFFGATVIDDQISAIRSTDGGASFGAPVRASALQTEDIAGVRAPPLPSVEVDRGGRIYAAWADCRFRPECTANDIVLASSPDGIRWSETVPVPTGPTALNPDYWVPGLAVDSSSTGAGARLAVAFHSTPFNCGFFPDCPGVDVGIVTSTNAGKSWSRPVRLNVQTMPLDWIAKTGTGRMLGDYISTSFVSGRVVPVFALAADPVEGTLRQAIFATPLPLRRLAGYRAVAARSPTWHDACPRFSRYCWW